MPGNQGIPGNERADKEAKREALSQSSPQQQLPLLCKKELPISPSAAWQCHMKKVNTKSVKCFESSPHCQRLWKIDPSMPSPRFRKDTTNIDCWHASMLIQLRTGHIPLQKHLHRLGHANSPSCLACHREEETVHHYIMTCPAYTRQRKWLHGQLRRAASSISTLLANPKAFKYLFRFIHDTGLFRNTPSNELHD